MMTLPKIRRRAGVKSRRGVVALFALMTVVLATAIGGLLLKAGLAERRHMERVALQSQAEWLAEAGLDRAAARLASSPGYAGETWKIAAAQFENLRGGGDLGGVVQISVVPVEVKGDAQAANRRNVHVTAEFPFGSVPPARAAKDLVMTVPRP